MQKLNICKAQLLIKQEYTNQHNPVAKEMNINLISIEPIDFALMIVSSCKIKTAKPTNNTEKIKVSFSFIIKMIGTIAAKRKKDNQSTKLIFLNFIIPKTIGIHVINSEPLKIMAKLFL